MAKLTLQGITRRFDSSTAIEDITFEVPDGKFWVLVGPSGCGKSTILRTIAGLEAVMEGKLFIGDTLVNQIPARQRDVAMVFQNYALYPHMTVEENLTFGLKIRKMDGDDISKRIEEVCRALDIAHLLKRKPRQLSGGQQQRVALGRAMAREPEIFLLDEPLSNLDAQLRDDTRAELKQLHERIGVTTVYVTHDQVEAMTLADKIVVLNRGSIQQIGTPQTIYNKPANRMVATFVGSPPMNIFPAIYSDGKFIVEGQTLLISTQMREHLQPSEGQSFELGIRPDCIVIASRQYEESEDKQENFSQLMMEVEVIEPLGRETLVRGNLVDSSVPVCLNAHATWQGKRSDRLKIQLDLDHLFVFDTQTGKTVYPQYS